MYICICSAVTDGAIREAVEGGTGNWKTLCKDLQIASQCGKCAVCAKTLFVELMAEKAHKQDTEPVSK